MEWRVSLPLDFPTFPGDVRTIVVKAPTEWCARKIGQVRLDYRGCASDLRVSVTPATSGEKE